jgi:nicotinic acid mononucleotide adenylyltransferase
MNEVCIAFALNDENSLVWAANPGPSALCELTGRFKSTCVQWWTSAEGELFSSLESAREQSPAIQEAILEALSVFFWFMPGGERAFYDRLTPDCLPILKAGPDKEGPWVFFGGAFDPWHRGHRACLELCRDKRLIVVPERGPWKDGKATSLHDFLNLIPHTMDLAFGLYPGFLTRTTPTPTVEWITQVKGPRAFLVGADHLRDMPKWHKFTELLNSLEALFVAPRAVQGQLSENMDQFFHQWRDELQEYTKTPIHLLDHHPFEHLSSTLLRLEKN